MIMIKLQKNMAKKLCFCQTHHVIPHGSSHVSVAPFTEVETVHREVGGVRFGLLEKKRSFAERNLLIL